MHYFKIFKLNSSKIILLSFRNNQTKCSFTAKQENKNRYFFAKIIKRGIYYVSL